MPCGTRTEKARCESQGFLLIATIKACFGVGNGGATGAARPSPVSAAFSPPGHAFPGNPARGCPGADTHRRSGAVRAVGRGSFVEQLELFWGGSPER